MRTNDHEFIGKNADIIIPGKDPGDTISPLPIRDCLMRLSRISRHKHSIRHYLDRDASKGFPVQNDLARDSCSPLVITIDWRLCPGALMQPGKEQQKQECENNSGHTLLPLIKRARFFLKLQKLITII